MKKLSKKKIEEMLHIWMDSFSESNGMNIYNREVCKKLREAGFSIGQLQDQIALIKIKGKAKNTKTGKLKKLTPTEQEVLKQYADLDIESDICRNEALCSNVHGLKFLQSSERGYSDKTAVDLNSNVSLMDVISENTKNRKEA